MDQRSPLKKAIDAAGGQAALAAKIGVTQSLVSYWLVGAKRGVPAEHAGAIERITGISRHALRPDVFGPAPKQEGEQAA